MKRIKISLTLNILIVLLTVLGAVCMFTGFKFMTGPIMYEAHQMKMFRFFTVDSNLFMGIVALIFAIKQYRVLTRKDKEISKKMYILKLMATAGVALTFSIVFLYLSWIIENGFYVMIMNSNLFFHLIIPVLSMITFMFFDGYSGINSKEALFGLTPMLIYGVFYITNILIHMENGKVSPNYDWYWFVQLGVWFLPIVLIIISLLTYVLSLLLSKINNRQYK